MRSRTRTDSVIRAGAGLVLVVIGILFVALLALLIARSVPIDEGKQWSSRIPLGTYATAAYLRGGV